MGRLLLNHLVIFVRVYYIGHNAGRTKEVNILSHPLICFKNKFEFHIDAVAVKMCYRRRD